MDRALARYDLISQALSITVGVCDKGTGNGPEPAEVSSGVQRLRYAFNASNTNSVVIAIDGFSVR